MIDMTTDKLHELVELLCDINGDSQHPLLNDLIAALSGQLKQGRESKEQAEKLYALYPRKVAKAFAIKAFQKALRKIEYQLLYKAVARFAVQCRGKEQQYIPHAATWCNQERYLDGIEELETPAPTDPNEEAARKFAEG